MIHHANRDLKPTVEYSLVTGTFVPMYFRSREWKRRGTFAPRRQNGMELSLSFVKKCH